MAGFTTNEGLVVIADAICKLVTTNRAANLELLLFTNVAADATLTHAGVTEPTGTGYARITLTDASWTGAAAARAYAKQTFTAGGAWTGSVKGYAICTTGATKKIIWAEIDAAGPYTFANGDTYDITPNITFS